MRSAPQSEEVFDFGDMGQIRFNCGFMYFRAHCPQHGKHCLRQRTVMESEHPNRAGQGRPLGLLAHWLSKADNCGSAEEHKKLGVGSYNDRKSARNTLKESHSVMYDAIQEYERDRRPEEREEPKSIP